MSSSAEKAATLEKHNESLGGEGLRTALEAQRKAEEEANRKTEIFVNSIAILAQRVGRITTCNTHSGEATMRDDVGHDRTAARFTW